MPSQSSCMKQRTAHGQKVCREPINFRSFFRGEANKVKRFHVTVRLEDNLLCILSLNSADKSEKVIISKSQHTFSDGVSLQCFPPRLGLLMDLFIKGFLTLFGFFCRT